LGEDLASSRARRSRASDSRDLRSVGAAGVLGLLGESPLLEVEGREEWDASVEVLRWLKVFASRGASGELIVAA